MLVIIHWIMVLYTGIWGGGDAQYGTVQDGTIVQLLVNNVRSSIEIGV